MRPKHTNPTRPRRDREGHETWARAPYNFVPLPERTVTVDELPSLDAYSGYTGAIRCTLRTASPLYTRSAASVEGYRQWGEKPFHELPEAEQEERARFFSVGDKSGPVLPGSSLRGMIRAMVEIAGYGKVQWVTDQDLIYRAVGDPTSLGTFYREQLLGKNKAALPDTHLDYPSTRLKGGYLKQSAAGWAIQPAVQHLGESFVHVEYDDATAITGGDYGRQKVYDVFVAPAPRTARNRGKRGPGDLILDIAITSRVSVAMPGQPAPAGTVPAKLIESGHMGGRHPKHWHCAIFEPDQSAEWIPIPDKKWRLYREDRELHRGLPTRPLTNDGDPLFYLLDSAGDLVFFGPTQMFRLAYPRNPLKLVPQDLRVERQIDLAEAIFGFTKGSDVPEKHRARAGRVFVSDAELVQGQEAVWLTEQPLTPKILGSPKATSFQHYLTQQNPDERRELDHYATPPEHGTEIRGTKLYWHKGNVRTQEIQEQDIAKIAKARKQYTRIQPVRAGVEFAFEIHFENLRDFELGALLWALAPPGEEGSTYRHKLGMGKPLGLGSVELSPTLWLSHRVSCDVEGETQAAGRYDRLFLNAAWYLPEDEQDDVTPFMKAFEKYVLDRIDPAERGAATSLRDLERIKMLLKMLEWPGPSREATRYMTIEPTNEYRERPVLPDPLAVVAGQPVQPPAGPPAVPPARPGAKPQAGPSRPSPQRSGGTKTVVTAPVATPGDTLTGTVRWFSEQKGYGFIVQEDGSDLFVHKNNVAGRAPLREGQHVTYRVGPGMKGPEAKDVRPA